jgi:hypothetical protein
MEDVSGADLVYLNKCYTQRDVIPYVFYLPKMLVFFSLSLQLATWRLYNYLNLVLNHFVYGKHKICVM